MKKTRMLATVAATAIVVVGVMPGTTGTLATNFEMFFIESPIDLSDGSIHAKEDLLHPWSPIVGGETYVGTTNNSNTIALHLFKKSSSDPNTDYNFTNTGAWYITITTGDPGDGRDGRTRNPEAIALCSTDGFSSACDPANMTIDNQNLVLIETHPDNTRPHGRNGHWAESLLVRKELTFQDTRPGCKAQNDKCEHVLELKLITANSTDNLPGPTGATFFPSDPRNFHIIVGVQP